MFSSPVLATTIAVLTPLEAAACNHEFVQCALSRTACRGVLAACSIRSRYTPQQREGASPPPAKNGWPLISLAPFLPSRCSRSVKKFRIKLSASAEMFASGGKVSVSCSYAACADGRYAFPTRRLWRSGRCGAARGRMGLGVRDWEGRGRTSGTSHGNGINSLP